MEALNQFVGVLHIDLTEEPERVANLLNEVARASARIKDVRLELSVWEGEEERELTERELRAVAIEAKRITICGEAEAFVSFDAPNEQHFTVRDMIDVIADTERRTRGSSEWFGGIDVHHIYFEGVEALEDGRFQIFWGS